MSCETRPFDLLNPLYPPEWGTLSSLRSSLLKQSRAWKSISAQTRLLSPQRAGFHGCDAIECKSAALVLFILEASFMLKVQRSNGAVWLWRDTFPLELAGFPGFSSSGYRSFSAKSGLVLRVTPTCWTLTSEIIMFDLRGQRVNKSANSLNALQRGFFFSDLFLKNFP